MLAWWTQVGMLDIAMVTVYFVQNPSSFKVLISRQLPKNYDINTCTISAENYDYKKSVLWYV